MSPRARVTLATDRDTFLLGENVLVHYCLANTGDAPFDIEVGGDYNMATRALGYKVSVIDEQGALVRDPDPDQFCVGGFVHTPTLAPGETFEDSLPLLRYARIVRPGTYQVHVVHSLGWPQGTAPVGRCRLRFTMPDAAEAEAVIARMESLPEQRSTLVGERSPEFRDFTALAAPIYLEPLRQRAAAGSAEAVSGIGAIETPEATRALLELAAHPDREIALAATAHLSMRVPTMDLDGALPRRGLSADYIERRRVLVDETWSPELAGSVRTAARRLITSSDSQDRIDGALFLQAVGGVHDAPELVAALDHAVDDVQAWNELLRAADVLVMRGHAPPPAPATPGAVAMCILAIAHGARPPRWEAGLASSLVHPLACVRKLALERLPEAPASVLPGIRAALADADEEVVEEACRLIGRLRIVALLPDVLALLARTKSNTLLDDAAIAADFLGATVERMDVLVSRLRDRDVMKYALGRLIDAISWFSAMGYGDLSAAQARELEPRWKAFVAKHRAAIAARRPIPREQVPTDLLPPGWSIRWSERDKGQET